MIANPFSGLEPPHSGGFLTVHHHGARTIADAPSWGDDFPAVARQNRGPVRLNKFISESGIASRREADAWIAAGRVTVNGEKGALGTRVGPGDAVLVDGKPLPARRRAVYIALHKPPGVTCTTERDVPGNIVDFVGHRERIFPIGRLDKDSEGLILLTNDGDIVNEVLREERGHEKEYLVTVDRPVTDTFLSMMAAGVRIGGVKTKPARVTRAGPNRFRIVLTQGLNRQIRRMCSALGWRVKRLVRVRIMHIRLGTLASGQWRNLTAEETRPLLAGRAPASDRYT
jgi:23S rRNA pseudouridine2604 synthase